MYDFRVHNIELNMKQMKKIVQKKENILMRVLVWVLPLVCTYSEGEYRCQFIGITAWSTTLEGLMSLINSNLKDKGLPLKYKVYVKLKKHG